LYSANAHLPLDPGVRTHILAGRISAATELLEKHFPAVLSADAPAPKPHKSLTGTDFVASTTLDPTHLTLNLRILAFTEAFRTTPDPLENPITESSDGDDPRATVLLSKARKLYAQVHMLANPIEREAYTTELRNVAGLLAYPDPLSSPVAKYLSQERREAVANQINTAILCELAQHCLSPCLNPVLPSRQNRIPSHLTFGIIDAIHVHIVVLPP
jgi:hypothetical protein